jgi:hypothetical protein
MSPGKKGERVRRELTVKSAVEVKALWPNLGPGAKSFEVTAIRSDGTVEPMLWLNNYRAEWPTSYVLKEPVSFPAGTRLVLTAYYDNPTDAPLQAKADLHLMVASGSRPPATLGR